ncbi:hypothetical protein [Paraburkholderia aromaticivorans]|uniref:hypothetical protein n=1 Tax=Paraburkholderia aromaticivorans TaxID=2026199 RepID=UPI0038BD7351
MTINIAQKLRDIESQDDEQLRRVLFQFFYELDSTYQHAIVATLLNESFEPNFLSESISFIITEHDKDINEVILNSLIHLVDCHVSILDLPGLLYLISGSVDKQKVVDTYRHYCITDTEYKKRIAYYFPDEREVTA